MVDVLEGLAEPWRQPQGSNGNRTNGNGNGWKRLVTLERLLLLIVLLFQAGMFWRGQGDVIDSVKKDLQLLEGTVHADEQTYERKDVLDPTLDNFRQQLADIKEWMRARADKDGKGGSQP